MEDWQKGFFEFLEVTANEVEQFLVEVTEEAVDAFDSLFQFSEEFTEQLQTTIFNDIEQLFNEIVEPVIEVYLGEQEQTEEINQVDLFVHYVEPCEEKNPACQGCQHYHGHVYSGNLLVCGMHPYGWDGDSCPDWQSY